MYPQHDDYSLHIRSFYAAKIAGLPATAGKKMPETEKKGLEMENNVVKWHALCKSPATSFKKEKNLYL
jgi:hypothetical protein